ncbi:MAG: hypothetical protein LBL72_05720 [Candidatus Accumulibacter sp.]|nr:hypothetical protein [Accumulibacter sp.]
MAVENGGNASGAALFSSASGTGNDDSVLKDAAPGSLLASGESEARTESASGALNELNELNESNVSNASASDHTIPEKYRVNKPDGSLDVEASAKKVSEAYRHLEQRLGARDAPPKSAGDYAPKIENAGFDWDEMKADPKMQGFLKGAHAKGMSNDQLSYVLGEYLKYAPELVRGAGEIDAEAARADLKQSWKSDAEFGRNIGLAWRAFSAFADEADRERIHEIGNNPIAIRILANIGKEMREDLPVNAVSTMGGDGDFRSKAEAMRVELEKLPNSDPRRKRLQEDLGALYERRYGARRQRLSGAAVIQRTEDRR